MKAIQIMTLEHALFWARQPETHRKVEMVQKREWSNEPVLLKIWVYDYHVGIGAWLPIPFKQDITRYLCEKEQNELMTSIEHSKKKLAKSIENCEGL